MREVSSRNFGLLIAYIIPGFVALWGVAQVSPLAASWLGQESLSGPSVGGFLYVTIASVGLGMTASALRWLIVDSFHTVTGASRPTWSDRELHERLSGYQWLIDNHYRYYQFYGNTLVAMLFTYGIYVAQGVDGASIAIGVLLLSGLFLAVSRNTLNRYHSRAATLLGHTPGD